MLATTLLVTTLLTVMLAASFLLVSTEQRTTDNSYAVARALALAQAGLQNYLSQNRGITAGQTYDSVRIALDDGYADVVATRVRPGQASTGRRLALWVVRSSGVSTNPVMAGQVLGTRTVAQFAEQNTMLLPARAPLVALNGAAVTAGGSTNPLSGYDIGTIGSCVPPGSGAADTVAVSVPWGGYFQDAGPWPYGRIDSIPSWSALYDSTHIDWASLVGGNFDPDYTIPPASYPGAGGNYYVYYVPGGAVIPSGTHRGLLIVTGNVIMQDGAQWNGVILAGGYVAGISGSADWSVYGMIVTGLNKALGMSVAGNSIKRQNAILRWSWCYTRSSISSLSTLSPVKGAWVDTWSTY